MPFSNFVCYAFIKDMSDLSKFVSNDYIGFQKTYCFDRILSQADFLAVVRNFELKSGLNLMAEQSAIPEILNGFVTMSHQNPPYCHWGSHNIATPHSSLIVTLYGKSKPTGAADTPHIFTQSDVTQQLVTDLDAAFQEKLVL